MKTRATLLALALVAVAAIAASGTASAGHEVPCGDPKIEGKAYVDCTVSAMWGDHARPAAEFAAEQVCHFVQPCQYKEP